jgi:hypothetical protein
LGRSEILTVAVHTDETRSGKTFTTITNLDTKEEIDSFWTEQRRNPSGRPPDGKQPHFYKLYKTNWNEIVKRKHLQPYEAGVFFMVLSFVGWESNFIIHPKTGANLNCSQLADLLDIERMQLANTMQALNRKGLIAIVKCGDGNSNHYMLNSNVVFWGSKIKDVSEHSRFIKDCPLELPIELKYKEREPK